MPRKERQRLQYIDTAKGICMLMLIFGHVGILPDYYVLYYFSLPVFFVLSGFFLKTGVGGWSFLKNRVNKLLVPFLFFYLVSYILFYIGMSLAPDIMSTEARGLMDMFTQRQWFNGPIWYLLCLFWSSLWLYLICRITTRVDLQALVVLCIGSIGATMGREYLFLPLMIDVSLSALPLLFIGYVVKRLPLMYPNKYDRYNLLVGIALLGLVLVVTWLKPYNCIGFHTNTVIGIYYWTLIIAILASFPVMYICKSTRQVPLLVYFGAYSLVPFSFHLLIYRLFLVAFIYVAVSDPLLMTALVTVIVSALMIPVMVKYMPWSIGLKQIIK